MAAPRKIDDAGRRELLAVALARRMLPSTKQLARKLGCSVRGVETEMRRLLDMIDARSTVSRGSICGTLSYSRPRAFTAADATQVEIADRAGPAQRGQEELR